jgi:hypothetical protein
VIASQCKGLVGFGKRENNYIFGKEKANLEDIVQGFIGMNTRKKEMGRKQKLQTQHQTSK